MRADRPKRLRCAVYTRKSSEEGLEQAFNSLDAQHEACEAYIRSQAGEGWQLIRTRYDDGGVSGGTIDRPALHRLLADIQARKIDTVVVYKVDRLTRSLADFAKIVEVFDTHGVSFVSVTQQFNTTTSMGRLTLNMLLSFAQFEREVTGERIRDKIAASKKKGMWMGGYVPLGYDARDRSLVINEAEAETVRTVFRLYLDHGSVRRVKAEADRRALVTKIRPTSGGRPLSRGYIYKLLNNPLYAGRIAHKDATYDGLHTAIIDPETWDAVQAMLAGNARARRSGDAAAEPSLLVGLLYDAQGDRLSPSHAVKNNKRYRYYISHGLMTGAGTDGMRIPSHEIETLVVDALVQLLQSRTRLFDLLNLEGQGPAQITKALSLARRLASALSDQQNSACRSMLRALLDRVTVARKEIQLVLSASGLPQALGLDPVSAVDHDPGRWTITVPARLRSCSGASRLIIMDDATADEPDFDPALVKMLTRAHGWFARLATGAAASAAEIARTEELSRPYVTRVLRLAFLAPDITEAILDGRQPPDLNAERLIRNSKLPLAWDEQRRILGFPPPWQRAIRIAKAELSPRS